ncbi:MAG: RagB/SusD family nutrient uptake outer membrane protein [Lewinellaceae bacterium]|nr:RagB/SusD family nutrient uptake outer membrane protein [Lewinellaceae bacterium]
MKKIISFIVLYLPILSMLVGLQYACNNLDEEITDRIIIDHHFKTDKDYLKVVGPLYTHLYGLGNHGGFFSLQEISSDEAVIPTRGNDWGDGGIWVRAHRHEFHSYDSPVSNAFTFLYAGIGSCNKTIALLKEAVQKGFADSALTDKYIAEIRALRALYYYWAMDGFGNIPVVLEFDLPDNFTPFTVQRADVFALIEQELAEVVPLLEHKNDATTYGRINYYAGKTLQAKLYLNAAVYTGISRWNDCLAACEEILQSGAFALEPNYRDNFITGNANSRETIFAVAFDEGFAPGFNLHMMTLHPASQATYNLEQQPWNGYCSLQEFYNKFEDSDIRKKNFIVGPQFAADGVTPLLDQFTEAGDPDGLPLNYTPDLKDISGLALRQEGARIGKYEFRNGAKLNLSNDMPVFHLADILLMKAEVLWRLDPGNPEALSLVNQVRNRAYEPDQPLNTLTAENLLDERGRELFYEGVRRQDMIRFGVFGNPTQFMPGSEPCKEIWPIPLVQLTAGQNIQQNPCY